MRQGLIRRVPERRGAGRDAWYQIPRLMTQSPLAALLPQRALSRDATNVRSFLIVYHAWPDRATPRYAWLRAAPAEDAGKGAAGASAKGCLFFLFVSSEQRRRQTSKPCGIITDPTAAVRA